MAQVIKGILNGQIRRFYQPLGLIRYMCSNHKDLATRHLQPVGTDFLYNNLKNATSTKSVLDIVSSHSNIMNNKHIIQALRSLFTLQKHGNSNLSTEEILGHKDFRKLCRQLRSQAPSIELNEMIEALKVVSYVGVPSDTIIVQVLLQLIRHNINFLNLQQIIFLEFLLSQFKSSPLVDALRLALPIVFEIQLPTKMEFDNVSHLADYLFFASKTHLSEDSVEKIVNALMTHKCFDMKTARSIVWSICDLGYNDMFRPLIKKAIDSLLINLDELTFNELETTLNKLIGRYSRKWDYFYNETFYDTCANYVIDKDLGYKHAVYILRKLSRVFYCNNFLLDYMSKKVHEDPDLVLKGDPVDIYSIVVSTALTDYRPVFWDHVKELISRSENISEIDRKEILWIRFGAGLCLLDIYKLDVLTKCLNEKCLQSLFSRNIKFMSDFDNYCTIWQCIRLFKPELNCLLNSKWAPEVLIKKLRPPMEFPLEGALHKALGGEIYVKTNLYSKMGHQIDHAIVLRKGGYPVAMNYSQDLNFVEDIELQPDNHLVLILGLRHYHYTLNNRRLKCSTLLSMKVLESKRYLVVPICLEVWESLPDFEKIPYLMRSMKENTEQHANVSITV